MADETMVWDTVPLEELTENGSPVTYGVVKPGEEGGVLFVRGGDIASGRVLMNQLRTIDHGVSQQYRRTLLRGGEILVSLVGNPGQVAIASSELIGANIARQVGLVRLKPTVDTRFVSYFLQSRKGQIALGAQSLGSVQQVINLRDLKTVKIPLPPLAEQKRIAEILGSLDDKIELNRKMNKTLEEMAQALFKSWFIDFDPVHANMNRMQNQPSPCPSPRGRGNESGSTLPLPSTSGRRAGDEGTGGIKAAFGLDAETAALFPSEFEDSKLGPIPKGWEVCPLSEKIELLSGGTPKTSESDYWDGDIPWYSVKDAPSESDVWVIHTEKHITKLGIENSAAQILPEGTTIISARGTVGKLALVGTPMAMNQSCYGIRGVKGYADYFTYFSLQQATAELQQRAHGTVFDTITRQTFETLDCIFSPEPLTQAFDKAVAPLLVQLRENLQQSRTLASLRDSLLPKLLNGELGGMIA